MIHTLWHSFRSWKVWTGGVILMGLLLIAAQCNGPQQATPLTENPPPKITGFTFTPSSLVLPGARIGIQVNVRLHGHRIDNYLWVVEEGEGRIVSGQGTSLITYEAPKTPRFCKVRVELEYRGGTIGDSAMVIVVPEPTSTPTDTSTPIPTDTPSPNTPTLTRAATSIPTISTSTPTLTRAAIPTPTISTNTPTPTPTATSTSASTSTPSPTLTSTPYPAPVLISPDEGTSFAKGQDVKLVWEWERDLAENEFFEVRIRLRGEQRFDPIARTQLSYEFVSASELTEAGTYEWQVAIVSLSGEEKGVSQRRSFEVR